MCASVVAGMDAAPILEPAEHVLDLMARAIERLVVGDWHLSASGRGDTGRNILVEQSRSEPVAVIAAIGDQTGGFGSASTMKRAPLWSLIWPSLHIRMMGLPWPGAMSTHHKTHKTQNVKCPGCGHRLILRKKRFQDVT